MNFIDKPPKLISIIIPAYNEEKCIEELCQRLKKLFFIENQYHFEVIIVENGSTDNSYELLKKEAKDVRFKILKLSRNFRMDGGLTAGLNYVSGDACVFMTADLQDPPELISEFLRNWELGYENVFGVVKKRTGTGFMRRLNSQMFYFVANRLTDNVIPKNASDFRLLDKKVYEVIRQMEERNRFVRGLVAWSGFKSIGVEMIRAPRFGGESKAPTLKVIDLALKGIFAHSYKPLRIMSILASVVSILAGFSVVPLFYFWRTYGVPFPGFGTVVALILIILSIISAFLVVISEYLAMIYEEVKKRPNFIISEKINLN